jgi:hypothetical protein
MKLFVPSIGSMTHRYSPGLAPPSPARGAVMPPSSPNTAWPGASRASRARAAASASLSATVTGDASALESMGSGDRKYRVVTAAAASATAWARAT